MTARTAAVLKANFQDTDPQDQMNDVADTIINPQDAWSVTTATITTLNVTTVAQSLADRLQITQGFDNDYAPVNAAAATEPDVPITGTIGTGLWAVSEASQNGTKYGQENWEYVLPSSFVAGTNVTAPVNVDTLRALVQP